MNKKSVKKIINMTEEGEALGYPKTPDAEMVEIGIFDGKIINFIKGIFGKNTKKRRLI